MKVQIELNGIMQMLERQFPREKPSNGFSLTIPDAKVLQVTKDVEKLMEEVDAAGKKHGAMLQKHLNAILASPEGQAFFQAMQAIEHDKALENRVESDGRSLAQLIENNTKIIETPAAEA